MINVEPKVLIISNNALSETNNNGKTLASFFKSYDSDNIAQLYFNQELPTERYFKNFYQISDASMLKSVFFPNKRSGKTVKAQKKINNIESNKNNILLDNIKKMLFKSNVVRLIRELIWKKGDWETEDLIDWVTKFSPDVIFFCAGDSAFAYQITNKLVERLGSKLVVYVTDDYILPRKTGNLFWWIRRNRILNRMEFILEISSLFITVSKKMSDVYYDFLGKDSIVLMNMTESLNQELNDDFPKDTIDLVYAGGLHLNRYKTLILLANAIKKYNSTLKEKDKRAFLKIYSASKPDQNIVNKINVSGASKYIGSLNSSEVKTILNKSDMPVHVESFDEKSIEATRLSISTKIPEYLSLEKPILAIGPNVVASMQYLDNIAFCINKPKDIFEEIKIIFNDEKLRNNLSSLSYEKFCSNHDLETNTELFRREIREIIN